MSINIAFTGYELFMVLVARILTSDMALDLELRVNADGSPLKGGIHFKQQLAHGTGYCIAIGGYDARDPRNDGENAAAPLKWYVVGPIYCGETVALSDIVHPSNYVSTGVLRAGFLLCEGSSSTFPLWPSFNFTLPSTVQPRGHVCTAGTSRTPSPRAASSVGRTNCTLPSAVCAPCRLPGCPSLS